MEIILRLETSISGIYLDTEEGIVNFAVDFQDNLPEMFNTGNLTYSKKLIIDQQFGFNGIVLCKDIKEKYPDIDIIYSFNMRDKNRSAIFSDLLTLKQLGLYDIIVSEGIHPLKTSFKTSKPVYDLDIIALISTVKNGAGEYGLMKSGDDSSVFRIGAITGASSPADLLRVEKLVRVGVDNFIINYSENIDKTIIKSIKGIGKPVYMIFTGNSIINSPKKNGENEKLDRFFENVSNMEVDAAIVSVAGISDGNSDMSLLSG